MTNSLPTVKLRALEPEDLEFFYSIENDPELWDVSDYTTPYSRYVLHDFIANSTCDIYKDGQVRWAIENEEGEVVGMIDLTNFDPHHSRAETGIVIAKKYRKNKYALSALLQLIRYAGSVLHLRQIYALINTDNERSVSLHEYVDFVKGTTLKDWFRTSNGFADAYAMQLFL